MCNQILFNVCTTYYTIPLTPREMFNFVIKYPVPFFHCVLLISVFLETQKGGGSRETCLHGVGHSGTAAFRSLDNVVRSTTATPIPALRY